MAGVGPDQSSARPQSAKLGIKEGSAVALVGAPANWRLSDPPAGVELVARGPADVVVAFYTAADRLAGDLPALGRRIFPAGMLWIAWPRRAAGHTSDITDEVVRRAALALGLVDTKVAAIDEDWSGLRLVWRKELRSGGAPPL